MDSPSVMSTCDLMQVTHMLDGLGRMEAPQRQQRLFGLEGGKGNEKRDGSRERQMPPSLLMMRARKKDSQGSGA